jgi:hypothetical protein
MLLPEGGNRCAEHDMSTIFKQGTKTKPPHHSCQRHSSAVAGMLTAIRRNALCSLLTCVQLPEDWVLQESSAERWSSV